jgi:hypothetical protein
MTYGRSKSYKKAHMNLADQSNKTVPLSATGFLYPDGIGACT